MENKLSDTKHVLHTVEGVYMPAVNSFIEKFSGLTLDEQREEKEWICEKLQEIDNCTFDSELHVSHPIRFWYNEYRHALATVFSHV